MVHPLRHSNVEPDIFDQNGEHSRFSVGWFGKQPWISKLKHDLREHIGAGLPLLPIPAVDIVQDSLPHHIPAGDPIFLLLHLPLQVPSEVVVTNEGQHLRPLLCVAQDILVPQTKLFPIFFDDVYSSGYAGVHPVISQKDFFRLVFTPRHHLRIDDNPA